MPQKHKDCLLSFYFQDRPYSYEIADVSEINVMLNNNDVSDYLKISPTGLEVRFDRTDEDYL